MGEPWEDEEYFPDGYDEDETDEDDLFPDDGIHCSYCGEYMIDDSERGQGCHYGCQAEAEKNFEEYLARTKKERL